MNYNRLTKKKHHLNKTQALAKLTCLYVDPRTQHLGPS